MTPALDRLRGYLVVAGALCFLSLSPIIVRLAQGEHFPSLLIGGLRMSIAALILTPFALRGHRAALRRLTRRDVVLLIATGVWMSLNGLLVILSLEHIPVLTNQMLASTAPVWVALLEVGLLRVRLHGLIWVGIVLVVGGSLFIALASPTPSSGESSLVGIVLALLSAVAGAVYLLIGRRVRPHIPIIPYLWIVYASGGVFGLTIALALGTPLTGYAVSGYGWVVVNALLVQLLGFSGMGYALAFFPATFVAVATRMVAVFSAVMAFVIFAEVPPGTQILGSVFLIAGIISAVLGQEAAAYRARRLSTAQAHA